MFHSAAHNFAAASLLALGTAIGTGLLHAQTFLTIVATLTSIIAGTVSIYKNIKDKD